ncbi:rho guanine nucleotide exchange factor 2-like [Mustelus asterias]
MDDFSMEMETKEMLKELADEIQQRDRGITELLEERAALFLQVLQLKASEDLTAESGGRRLFRSESNECPKGEKLIADAVKEVQSLSELMVDVCGTAGHSLSSSSVDQTPGTPAPGGGENTSGPASANCNSDQANVNGSGDVCRTDSLTVSAQDRNGNQLQLKSHNEEVLLRLSRVSTLLHALQTIVVKQDSLLESQRQQLGDQRERLSRQNSRESPLVEQERARSAEKQREELAGLRRQHGLLQEEFQRCRRACEERAQEQRALEARLQESERCRVALERALEESGREAPLQSEQAHRRKKSHTRQFSLPSAQLSGLTTNGQQNLLQRRRSADETCLWKALSCEGTPNPRIAGESHSEGPGCPWPEGQETTACRAGEEEEEEEEGEGTESGPGREASIQEGLLEEESEDESESPPPSSVEDAAELGRPQNIPEGGDSDRPGPGGGETPADLHVEEEDDDMYY